MVNVYSGKTSYFSKADVTSEKQQKQGFLFVRETPCRLTHWALRRHKKQTPNSSSSECPSIGAVFPLQLCLHSWTSNLPQDNRPSHPDPKLPRPGSSGGAPQLSPWLWVQMSNRTGWACRARTGKCTVAPHGLGAAWSSEF